MFNITFSEIIFLCVCKQYSRICWSRTLAVAAEGWQSAAANAATVVTEGLAAVGAHEGSFVGAGPARSVGVFATADAYLAALMEENDVRNASSTEQLLDRLEEKAVRWRDKKEELGPECRAMMEEVAVKERVLRLLMMQELKVVLES